MFTKDLRGRDFLAISRFSKEEIETIIDTALQLKLERSRGVQHHLLADKTLFMLFYNRSLRTRNSFEVGMTQLGGHANYLDVDAVYTPSSADAEHAFVTERICDVAGVLSRYGEGIAIRIFGDPTEWHVGRGREYLEEFASAADIPVINMEDDLSHPTQAIADVITMREKLGSLEGRKVVVSWAYSPSRRKPVSVPHSVMSVCSLYGAHIVLARPEGFELDRDEVAHVRANVARYGGSFVETSDLKEAFVDADVVYPKCWPSLRHLPPFAPSVDWAAQDALFEQHRDWIVDEPLMKLTRSDSLYMHCLPADRGYEVTDSVIDGPHSVVYDQAENRLHGEKAVMALTM